MQQTDDLRALSRIMDLLRVLSILAGALHLYCFRHASLERLGMTSPHVDRIVARMDSVTGLLSVPLRSKVVCLGVLAVSCLGTRSVKSLSVSPLASALTAAAGSAVFLAVPPYGMLSGMGPLAYPVILAAAYLTAMTGMIMMGRVLRHNLRRDVFNIENESFLQEERLMENEYSVNIPTLYCFRGRERHGWINVVNPFRATIVLGTPGSGKSYAIINSFIRQMISKGYSMYIYDYKYPDLSRLAYNCLLRSRSAYAVSPEFRIIDFDDPRQSHRCNPLDPQFMTDISDAYESAYTIMLNLNRTWIQKQGDFFVESPIILLAAIIWYLKIYSDGMYCTFPHAIEFLNRPYSDILPILTSYPQLENYLSPFMDAWHGGAAEQLQGQIASAKIPLSRLISPQLYWVMSGNDFTLDINNPRRPKILVIANSPGRQNIYGAALGLYNSRIISQINRKGRQKCAVIIDELPTIFFKGLDNLIATARSNRVAVCLGFQDYSQLVRDYGDKEADVIINTVGNIFSGQVVGKTAHALSERFGKILQQREGLSVNSSDTGTSLSTQLDSLIPESKISSLSQGHFIGAVSDNLSESMEQKMFNCRIDIDSNKLEKSERGYTDIPQVCDFGPGGEDAMRRCIDENYQRIRDEVRRIVSLERERIHEDPLLRHLLDDPRSLRQ